MPAPQLADPAGSGDDGSHVGAVERRLDLQDVKQVALLDALGLVGDQPLGAAHPARPDGLPAPQERQVGDPQRGHRRLPRLPGVEVAVVRLLAGGQRLLDVTQPPGRVTQSGQVIRRQRSDFASSVEALAGSGPVATGVGVACRCEDRVHLDHGLPWTAAVSVALPGVRVEPAAE